MNTFVSLNLFRFGFRWCQGIVYIFNLSEYSHSGRIEKNLDSILLNGGGIAMIVPGAEPSE